MTNNPLLDKYFDMNHEQLQKFLDDNNITIEDYLRNNMASEEFKKYCDNIWIDAIYREFGEDT